MVMATVRVRYDDRLCNYNYCQQVHEYNVAMTCSGCTGAVQRVLGRLQGGN